MIKELEAWVWIFITSRQHAGWSQSDRGLRANPFGEGFWGIVMAFV